MTRPRDRLSLRLMVRRFGRLPDLAETAGAPFATSLSDPLPGTFPLRRGLMLVEPYCSQPARSCLAGGVMAVVVGALAGYLRWSHPVTVETSKQIARRYVQTGGRPEAALPYFTRTAGPRAIAIAEEVAHSYREAERLGEAATVARALLERDRESPRRCVWQAHLLRADVYSDFLGAVEEERARLGEMADAVGSEECRVLLHDLSRAAAIRTHKAAHRSKSKETYATAAAYYRAFLARFADSPEAYDLRFYFGEALWILELWDEAAEQYRETIRLDPRGKFSEEAAYAFLLARVNALPEGERDEPPRLPEEPAAPVPFPPQWQRMMEAFDFYLAHSADRDVRPKVLFRKARALYAYGHLTQAVALSRQLIDTYPEHGVLSDTLRIYFEALEAMGQRPLACQEAKHWLSDPMAADHHARIALDVQEAACRNDWERTCPYRVCRALPSPLPSSNRR